MYIQFPGRRAYMVVILSLTLFACHQADHPADTAASRRMNLITALKELRGRILSGDKAQIGKIFSFPVPDSVFHSYVEDSVFRAQWEKNGDVLTQRMFNRYFDKICDGVDFDRFKSIFSFIDLDSLEHRDAIDVDTVLAKEGSSRVYSIHILGDSAVDITYGSGHCVTGGQADSTGSAGDTARVVKDTVAQVSDSASSVDDPEEDDPSACEHDTFWVFSFDGKTLHLVHQDAAD